MKSLFTLYTCRVLCVHMLHSTDIAIGSFISINPTIVNHILLAVKNIIPSCIMSSPPDLEALSVNIGGKLSE